MSKKPRNPTVDYAIYLAVRLVVCVLQAFPVRIALGLASLLAWLAYRVDKRHREVARENIRYAFPELIERPEKIDQMVRECYRHFCTVAVEIAVLPRRIYIYNWRKFATPVDFPSLIGGLLDNRPLLMVTAHYGNWEVAGYVTGTVGLRTYAIARVLDNPYLERFLNKFREKTGQTILSKTGDFERITSVLTAGGAIATLGDQDAGPKGMFVNFFGRPASTHKAVALLSIEYDAPMVVLGIPRIGWPLKFAIEIEDTIDPRDYRDRSDALREMTVRFTGAIERMVRRHPEQYFWLHRRWKHQPPAGRKR